MESSYAVLLESTKEKQIKKNCFAKSAWLYIKKWGKKCQINDKIFILKSPIDHAISNMQKMQQNLNNLQNIPGCI